LPEYFADFCSRCLFLRLEAIIGSINMKFRILQWLGLMLILQTGLVHLYLVPETFAEATYEGLLFLANTIGAAVAVYGIYRGKIWGWNLGVLIAAGSIVAYIVSRTVGMPGMKIEDWSNPLGVGSLVVESAFLAVCLLLNPKINLASSHSPASGVMPAAEIPIASRYLIPALSLVTLLLALLFTYQWNAHRPGAVLISQQDLKEKYGLQVTLLGVTAMDGMIDLRLKVLDADKASQLLEGHAKMPALIVENGEEEAVNSARMSRHGSLLKTGGVYIAFFPNPRHEIQSGTPVSVVFGEFRLAPVVAQ
jgi:hypothetical protein